MGLSSIKHTRKAPKNTVLEENDLELFFIQG